MKIGVPKETLRHEHRVGLTRFAVSRLSNLGHEVYVEHDAGRDSHFSDEDYQGVGAQIVYTSDEVCARADLICRVGAPGASDVAMLGRGATVLGFLHLAVMPREVIAQLAEREVTMIGYEVIQEADGSHPVLRALSEIGGHMAVHTAARLLEHEAGGRGLVLGGVPGVPPATVVILGAGTVGRTAARLAQASGAHVILMDADMRQLHGIHDVAGCPSTVTVLATQGNLERYTAIADVLIGAVLVPGARAPYLVTSEMVQKMKPGSVILDLSIDQGGCVETSRPTTPDNPTFKAHGVTHFCVPNMTANVPRTASRAMVLTALPYLTQIAERGVEQALRHDAGLAKGVYMYRGRVVHEPAAEALGVSPHRLADLLG
ncbi:MAG: alanine dehydrogenase [Acidobacteria bacterium]|nr:alanine dehydrogenase [Acidobacteriota bacterium]